MYLYKIEYIIINTHRSLEQCLQQKDMPNTHLLPLVWALSCEYNHMRVLYNYKTLLVLMQLCCHICNVLTATVTEFGFNHY